MNQQVASQPPEQSFPTVVDSATELSLLNVAMVESGAKDE